MSVRGGIITNLDKRLTDAEVEKVEQGERRKEFIDERVKAAEKTEKEGIGDAPDIIYSGLQRGDVYTADPGIDNDPHHVRRMYQMRRSLPVKQREISPEGDWILTLSPEMVQAVAQRLWCTNCEEPQPDNDIEWGAAAIRLEQRIGPRPAWAAHGDMCCYCGARLGLQGDSQQAVSLIHQMTPDQRRLLEEMFGKIES